VAALQAMALEKQGHRDQALAVLEEVVALTGPLGWIRPFVKAEIRNAALEKEEMQFSLQEEMEPVVPQAIDPAKDLSRAYRYVRKHHWRMAIIYLDHLEKKYPHWGALFYAKAMGFKGMHETEKAIASLSLACDLGNQDACMEIEAADPSD
jgi:hypothetical protein